MGLAEMMDHREYEVLVLDPPDRLVFPYNWPERSRRKFYWALFSYGFRTLLKDLVLHRERFTVSDLTRYCSEASAQEYLKELLRLKLVRKIHGGAYALNRGDQVFSFGETLEWFVANIFIRELQCEAWWGVVLKGEGSGGDYDVLAECENRLVYVEVKSAPPKSIEIENIRAFLNRINDLRPDLAIFLEDTTLRMQDKILPHFQEETRKRGEATGHSFEWVPVHDETYRCGDLFLTNTKPGILENLQLCLSTYLKDKGLKF